MPRLAQKTACDLDPKPAQTCRRTWHGKRHTIFRKASLPDQTWLEKKKMNGNWSLMALESLVRLCHYVPLQTGTNRSAWVLQIKID